VPTGSWVHAEPCADAGALVACRRFMRNLLALSCSALFTCVVFTASRTAQADPQTGPQCYPDDDACQPPDDISELSDVLALPLDATSGVLAQPQPLDRAGSEDDDDRWYIPIFLLGGCFITCSVTTTRANGRATYHATSSRRNRMPGARSA
jgi:hypothetical protein